MTIDLSVAEAYKLFKKANLQQAPIADNNGDIVGVLLKDDLWSVILGKTTEQ